MQGLSEEAMRKPGELMENSGGLSEEARGTHGELRGTQRGTHGNSWRTQGNSTRNSWKAQTTYFGELSEGLKRHLPYPPLGPVILRQLDVA